MAWSRRENRGRIDWSRQRSGVIMYSSFSEGVMELASVCFEDDKAFQTKVITTGNERGDRNDCVRGDANLYSRGCKVPFSLKMAMVNTPDFKIDTISSHYFDEDIEKEADSYPDVPLGCKSSGCTRESGSLVCPSYLGIVSFPPCSCPAFL